MVRFFLMPSPLLSCSLSYKTAPCVEQGSEAHAVPSLRLGGQDQSGGPAAFWGESRPVRADIAPKFTLSTAAIWRCWIRR